MNDSSTTKTSVHQATEPTVAELRACAERGITWILAQQRDDGAFCAPEDGVGGYYKVPMAFGGYRTKSLMHR